MLRKIANVTEGWITLHSLREIIVQSVLLENLTCSSKLKGFLTEASYLGAVD